MDGYALFLITMLYGPPVVFLVFLGLVAVMTGLFLRRVGRSSSFDERQSTPSHRGYWFGFAIAWFILAAGRFGAWSAMPDNAGWLGAFVYFTLPELWLLETTHLPFWFQCVTLAVSSAVLAAPVTEFSLLIADR